MNEREKAIKQKILDEYCQAKPGSIVAEIRTKLGDDLTIALLDNFSGRLFFIPNKSSLRRSALPMLIEQELKGVEPNSPKFKAKIKVLAEYYKLTQKAIKQINRKGVYSR